MVLVAAFWLTEGFLFHRGFRIEFGLQLLDRQRPSYTKRLTIWERYWKEKVFLQRTSWEVCQSMYS